MLKTNRLKLVVSDHEERACSFLAFEMKILICNIAKRWYDICEKLDAVIFVVDSTDKKSIKTIREELVKLNTELISKNPTILLFLNKQDDTDKLVDYQDLIEEMWVNEVLQLDKIVQKCSAKTGEGLIEGFEKLTNMMFSGEKVANKTVLNSDSFRMSKILK